MPEICNIHIHCFVAGLVNRSAIIYPDTYLSLSRFFSKLSSQVLFSKCRKFVTEVEIFFPFTVCNARCMISPLNLDYYVVVSIMD